MEGWVDLGDRYNTKMIYPHIDSHPCIQLLTRQCTASAQELKSRPIDHKSDALTTTPPSHLDNINNIIHQGRKYLMEQITWN